MAKESLQDRIAKAKKRLEEGDTTDADALRKERSARTRKRNDAEVKRSIKAMETELGTLQLRQDFIDRLAEAPDPTPHKITKKKDATGAQATYVMCASDWHVGERVRPENVGGKNEYNPEIAEERAEQFWKSQLLMLNAARSAWNIRNGVLWLGGDLITGYIHEEFMEENFLSPSEESLLAYKLIVSGIKSLLASSDLEEILIATSNGNHGRTGEKMRISTSAKNSYEWLLYQFLRFAFAEEPRIKWQIGTGYNNIVDVYGFRINFSHGDRIGFQGGVGGTTIPGNKRIHRQSAGLPLRFEGTSMGAAHLHVWGHFHQLMYPKNFIQNGSLIGWNDFAEAIAAGYEDPQQCSFVIDERYKIVSNFNPILVTKPRK